MLECRRRVPAYIVIDALDECPKNTGSPSPREKVLQLVKELVDLRLPNLHICLASCPEVDIRTVLEPLKPIQVSLHDESGQRKDILDYITNFVYTDPTMGQWNNDEKELVIKIVSDKADGM
jgi:hypothetical protein